MQIYIIGIGQCGTSVAFDVISELTGFVKSKEVGTLPEKGRDVDAARNELEKRLNEDFTKANWKATIRLWLSRLWNNQRGRKAFILPKIAIIDGNPNNFVKDAFAKFSGTIGLGKDERRTEDLEQLISLIRGTNVLDLGDWRSGCANGLVGEAVTAANLPAQGLRKTLGVDGRGNLTDDDGIPFPVSVFLVISSGGGATGSGGGVYLTRSDALLAKEDDPTAAGPPNHTIITNAIVLPSVHASLDNRKYALNAGRSLARHGNMITQGADGKSETPSATILFSNPRNEGNPQALQQLNNYLAEFAIRVANFTFPGNVATIARDVDDLELTFLRRKTSVLAMSHLVQDDWYEGDLEAKMAKRAFVNMYESDVDKPYGLSVEDLSRSEGDGAASGLSTTSTAMVAIGVPPTFKKSLSIGKINGLLREHSGSPLPDIRTFAYGARESLELTVFLRYRSMGRCALAMHFVRQYLGEQWQSQADEVPETEHVVARAEGDDDDSEPFEDLAAELDRLGGRLNFGGFTLRRPAESRASVPPAGEGAGAGEAG